MEEQKQVGELFMTLGELAQKLSKNNKAWKCSILATDNINYLYYINELIYDDDYKKIYLIMNYDLKNDYISPNDIVKESKKSYKNYYQVELLCMEDGIHRDIDYTSFSQFYNPNGNYILYF